MIKITTAVFGDSIERDGNLKNFIEKQEFQILLKVLDDNHKLRFEVVLNKKEALCLKEQLEASLSYDGKNGFMLV